MTNATDRSASRLRSTTASDRHSPSPLLTALMSLLVLVSGAVAIRAGAGSNAPAVPPAPAVSVSSTPAAPGEPVDAPPASAEVLAAMRQAEG